MFGLRTRFVAACLLMVSVSTAVFSVAIAQFVELLEHQLGDVTLMNELDEFAAAYRRDPRSAGPHSAALNSIVLRAGEPLTQLPPALAGLAPGLHAEVHIDHRTVSVARTDVDGARLYLIMDMEPVERLESRFVGLAWLAALASWLMAVMLALWLARRVLRPVGQLADQVAALRPGEPGRRLAPGFDDRDIGVIADAFDRFMERMDAFVAREQAFTEDASHELRNPLAVIDSATQLLAADPQLPPPARGRVQRIQRSVRQMQMLIEALLFLSREQGGAAAETLRLDRLVEDIVDVLRDAIAAKSLQVQLQLPPARLHAPRGMAACVVSNLLNNAVHFTDHGQVGVQLEGRSLVIEDSGIGIPPEDLEHIFERRFRGSQSRGMGLGLYLVKRICDRLGWSVRVSSRPGRGTRFEIGFPDSALDLGTPEP